MARSVLLLPLQFLATAVSVVGPHIPGGKALEAAVTQLESSAPALLSSVAGMASGGTSLFFLPFRLGVRATAAAAMAVLRLFVGDRIAELEKELDEKVDAMNQLRRAMGQEVGKLQAANEAMHTRMASLKKIVTALGESAESVDKAGARLDKYVEAQKALTEEQQQLAEQQKILVAQQTRINMFYAADADHDGRVSREEAATLGLAWDFDKLDKDGDGTVSMAELVAAS